MDKKELENFRKQSDEVMTGIEKLQKEIKKYKTGAESFEVAAELLQNVVDEQSEVTKKLKEYIFGLYDIDTEKVVERLKSMEGAAEKMTREVEIANKTTGELLPMVNDLWGVTEDLEKNLAELVGRVEKISEKTSALTMSYENVCRELESRGEKEKEMSDRIDEEKIWIERLMKRMEKMDSVAQRIENAEKRIEEKIKVLK